MRLHRFNNEGLQRFHDFLDALSANPAHPIPSDLLTDASCLVSVRPAVDIEPRQFVNRLEAATYLDARLSDVTCCDVHRDVGLWTWLTLFYFDQVCPSNAHARRKPRERACYVPAIGEARRHYRHLLAGPWRVYRAHRDDPRRAMVLLYQPLHKLNHFVYQLVSRQELVTNPAVIGSATRLYLSPQDRPRRGASGQGPGGVFRFAALMNQIDLTWDLYEMTADRILDMLPAEFDRFRRSA